MTYRVAMRVSMTEPFRAVVPAAICALIALGTPACTSDESENGADVSSSPDSTADADASGTTDTELAVDVAADVAPDADSDSGAASDSDVGEQTDADDAADVASEEDAPDDATMPDDTDLADGVDDTPDAVDSDARPADILDDSDASVPDPDDLPFGPRPALTDVLEWLELDPENHIRLIANRVGWPMPIADGTLFVTLDPSMTHVAGDFDGWDGTLLNESSGFRWVSHPDVRTGQRYKFTDLDRYEADPWSRALVWDEFGEMSLVVPDFAHVQRYFALTDGTIGARNLFVWVPGEPVTHVLYAHDGQNLFGPGSAFGSWRMEEAAPDGMLIVGIFNTADRFDDYTPVTDRVGGSEVGGGADTYLAFVRDTVRPLIRTEYGEPGPVGILGSSLGGVVSLYALVVQPGEWDFAASLSGALSWGSRAVNNGTLHASAEDLAASGAVIYLDSGGGGDTCVDSDGDGVNDDDPAEADDYCVTAQLRDQLADAGLEFSSTLWHWWEPGALHNEAAWSARVSRPLFIFQAMALP